MTLQPQDLATISRLLDTALALPRSRRAAWLAALAPEHAALVPHLEKMLAEGAARGVLSTHLPALDDAACGDDALHAGLVIGPYRLVHELGRGGMGCVWLADRIDAGLNRRVALKLPRLSWVAGMARRMARERDIGARLEHAHIARLYDAGVDARGWPYLAFEYIDGQPIDHWCAAQALSVRERVGLIIQVADAVAFAHARQVIHRDLKPANVLVTADANAHLLDFGIAKLLDDELRDAAPTRTQGRAMTLQYAAPEQILGHDATTASDVYSLGALAYELLAGVKPFVPDRDTAAALEEAILRGHAPPASSRAAPEDAPSLWGDLDSIIETAMRLEPGARYASADVLVADLRRHLDGDRVAGAGPLHSGRGAPSGGSERQRARGADHARAGPRGLRHGRGLRVLHLDDHALFCEGLALVVATIEPHATVQRVHSVADACAALRAAPPDIVLADLHLPDCRGVDVVRTLRAVDEKIPLAVLSASEDAHVVQACIDAGAVAFVRKGARLDEMRDAIVRLVAGVLGDDGDADRATTLDHVPRRDVPTPDAADESAACET